MNEIDSIVKNTYNEAASWLGLEPGTFRWHVKTSICNIKKLINADRMHRKGSKRVILTSLDKSLKAATSTNKVYSRARPYILNAKNISQHTIIQYLYV